MPSYQYSYFHYKNKTSQDYLVFNENCLFIEQHFADIIFKVFINDSSLEQTILALQQELQPCKPKTVNRINFN